MLITFEQVGILFLFATVGYLLSKTKLVQPAHSKILSTLLVYIFLPCNIFKTYTANFNLTYLTQKYD
ncbi:MAG: AEC family transporter, partial [Oscillospiraceae bacterium]|nr:AEC family transporter [Oscillospiraceae bacterium]